MFSLYRIEEEQKALSYVDHRGEGKKKNYFKWFKTKEQQRK